MIFVYILSFIFTLVIGGNVFANSTENFIPKAPSVPKVSSKMFEHLTFKKVVIPKDNSNKNSNKKTDLLLPAAWFFSVGFKDRRDPDFVSYFNKLKKLKIPVYDLYCKGEKRPVQLHIGPYFDQNPGSEMLKITKKTNNLELKKWLRKMMVVESYKPTDCVFIS